MRVLQFAQHTNSSLLSVLFVRFCSPAAPPYPPFPFTTWQLDHVFTLDVLRCVFDTNDADGPNILPQLTSLSFRNDTHVLCPAPPSYIAQPPYLNHGATLGLTARTVSLRRSAIEAKSNAIATQTLGSRLSR